MNAITAWSYSRYEQYVRCPLQFKLAVIDKVKTPVSDAMDRGRRLHTEAAAYEGLQALGDLHQARDITVYATAVIAKDAAGAVSVKNAPDSGPIGRVAWRVSARM
jgi:hypothetical protein